MSRNAEQVETYPSLILEKNKGWKARPAPRALSVLRIVAGFLVFVARKPEVFRLSADAAPFAGNRSTAPCFFHIRGELGTDWRIAGTVRAFTLLVAFFLSGMMAVAYFTIHAPKGFLPLVNSGELAAFYCFVFLYLFFAGGGEWSLDRLIQNGV
jgi:putative oxidoreductase